ncbi:MAG: DUF2339 domain-containing protein [Verrucomicrobiota bacterium]
MEVLILILLGVFLILAISQSSKLGDVKREIGEMKSDVRESLVLLRERDTRERSREVKESLEREKAAEPASEEDDVSEEPPPVAVPEPEEESEKDIEGKEAEEVPAYSAPTPPPLPARVAMEPVPDDSEAAGEPVPLETAVAISSEPGKFETAAREILSKIWNWIVVGEEHRPQGVTMEYAVATTWLLRFGVLILLVGIGFFLKYASEQGMIGPIGRVVLATVTGLGLVVGGIRLFGGRYGLLGQGLAGAGFATLYFSFFTAHQQYELISAIPAFGVMLLVTLASGFIAVRFNSQLIAVLGLLGGYLTPMMISTATPSVVGLFSYVLMLGLGVFFVAWKKEWRLLHYLSFVCTYGLFWTAVEKGFNSDRFWEFMAFLTAFFVLFSTVTFIYHLVNQKKATLLELLFLFLNAGVFFASAAYLVDRTFPREAIAVVTLGLAIFYIVHIYAFLRRKLQDKGLILSFLGLASLFVAITLPLILSEGWITVSWAVQGFVMLWIAAKMKSEFLRQLAYVLYLIVLARFAIFDLGSQFSGLSRNLPASEYWLALLERLMVFGVPIVSFFSAGKLFGRELGTAEGWAVGEGNDIKPWFGQSKLSRVCFWIVVILSFVYLNLEIFHSVGSLFDPLTRPTLTLLWIGLAAVLVREMLANRDSVVVSVFFWLVAVAVVIKVFFFDFYFWRPDWNLVFMKNDLIDHFAMRLLDYGMVIAFFMFMWQLFLKRGDQNRGSALVFGYAGLVGLFIYSSLEVWTGLNRFLPEFTRGGITLFWSIFAFGLLFAGISKYSAALRRLGLGLAAVVVFKVFFVDLADLDQLYRIIAFIVLGVVVLVMSFLYLKYRHRFEMEAEDTKEESNS